MKYFLIRHGESEANKQNILEGHGNSNLSNLGFEQAELLGKQLSGTNFCAIYSSDLKRAHNTALKIINQINGHIIITPQIKERSVGNWEGTKIGSHKNQKEPINAETPKETLNRIIKFLNNTNKLYKAGNILIITHGRVINILLTHILGNSFTEINNMPYLENSSITTIEYNGKEFKIINKNLTNHLYNIT